jgi:hypothetical protein
MASSPPPILPSPDGWRRPGVLLPWAPRRLAVAGLLFSFLVVWYALGLVVTAWRACDIVSAGGRFGIVTVVLPALVLVMWVVYSIGVFAARSQPMFVRFVAGAILVVAAVLVLVTVMVPDSPPEDYRNLDLSEYPECGPAGVPTWWPAWLPS